MKYKIEVCVGSVFSAIEAEKGGASRVELCDNLFEGGTTPSIAAIEKTCELLNIPVHVMIRPRGGDFLYSDLEYEIMKKDISYAKKGGASGVVIGLLLPDGSVDECRTAELVKISSSLGMGVTFHRAFDMASNPYKALESIIKTGCERILTSGRENKAVDGKDLIKELAIIASERISIMAGSGINLSNAKTFLDYTGIKELHMSGKHRVDGKMLYRNTKINMGGLAGIPEFEQDITDSETISKVIKAIEI